MFKIPFKLKHKAHKDVFLTIDIGSQTVKCMVFKVNTDTTNPAKLKLVGIGKEWLEPFSVRSGNIVDLDKVAKATDAAIYKATEGLGLDIDDVIFGVSGNVCTCTVTTGKATRKKEQVITAKELEDIDKRILEAAYDKAQELVAKKTGNYDVDLELITTATVYTKLEGNYEKNAAGKTGSEIETALFTAYTPKYYISTLEKLASMLNLNILAVTSNLYALVETLKLSYNTDYLDGIVIDIGSDTTDVGLVFGGGIVASKSMQIAGNHFTKQISSETGLTFAEAEKKKYEFSYGHMNDADAVQFLNKVNTINNLWLNGLEILFSDFDGVKTFASKIYLTGGASKLPTIVEALETNPWTRSIPFKEPPEFVKVNIKDIKHVTDAIGEADKAEYMVPIALSVIYLEIQSL